jgi:hypothetical protein
MHEATRKSLALTLTSMVLVACGASQASNANHSTAVTIRAQVTAAGAALSCRLPVGGFVPPGPKGAPGNSIDADGQPSQKSTGGFLELPGGAYTPTSSSDRSYLAGAGTWVPVYPQAIAPDERSYIETRVPVSPGSAPATTTLFFVDVRTGSRRLLYTAPDGQLAAVLAYTPLGVFVMTFPSGKGPSGLEVIDPATGAHRSVAGAQATTPNEQLIWMAVSGSTAWGMDVTNLQTSAGMPATRLVKLSLIDGSVADWYDSPGPFTIAGLDASGHPIIFVLGQGAASPTFDLRLVAAPKQSIAVEPNGGTFLGSRGPGVTDSHGTWFGGPDGSIWLYSSTGSFNKVASIPPQPGDTGQPYDPHAWRTIAGPCV